eukprot:m.315354 g.315354  ORF g.315354 m.315354 type:complete len:273 (-) comp16497_c1_seq20:4332-5150(-)
MCLEFDTTMSSTSTSPDDFGDDSFEEDSSSDLSSGSLEDDGSNGKRNNKHKDDSVEYSDFESDSNETTDIADTLPSEDESSGCNNKDSRNDSNSRVVRQDFISKLRAVNAVNRYGVVHQSSIYMVCQEHSHSENKRIEKEKVIKADVMERLANCDSYYNGTQRTQRKVGVKKAGVRKDLVETMRFRIENDKLKKQMSLWERESQEHETQQRRIRKELATHECAAMLINRLKHPMITEDAMLEQEIKVHKAWTEAFTHATERLKVTSDAKSTN